jgi:branched-chain amino acid aminotransferase
LGVHASEEYKFIIIASPVASYYKEGLNPVKILVSHEYVRAVKGGLGGAKTAANYAASLLAGKKAKELGFSQVLWLDGVERRYIDEVGAMNIVFVIDGEIITPPIEQGSILPGVTRDTVLTLAREWNLKVTERRITIDEVYAAAENGKLNEVFGTGTSAVISPVGLLSYMGKEIIINDGKIGALAQRFYDAIQDIQFGLAEDVHH